MMSSKSRFNQAGICPLNAFVAERLESRRLLSAGSLDPFFGNGGIDSVYIGSNSSGTLNKAVVALPDGRAYLAGGGLGDLALARITFDGEPDPTFGNGGVV